MGLWGVESYLLSSFILSVGFKIHARNRQLMSDELSEESPVEETEVEPLSPPTMEDETPELPPKKKLRLKKSGTHLKSLLSERNSQRRKLRTRMQKFRMFVSG